MRVNKRSCQLRRMLLCLLALLCLSTLLEAGHVHALKENTTDCAICLQAGGQHAAAGYSTPYIPTPSTITRVITLAVHRPHCQTITSQPIRAPPPHLITV